MNLWKTKLFLFWKELDLASKKNISLKNDFDSHVCHASVASHSTSPIACTSSSKIDNDICLLKKSVDCLGSTLSHCALNPHIWNPCFARNKFHLCMHTIHGIHMLRMFMYTTRCMLLCTLVHIVDVRATLINFATVSYTHLTLPTKRIV